MPDERRRARRGAEARVRRTVVACVRWGARRGLALRDVAHAIGLSPRTVRAWRASTRIATAARGRPAHVLTPAEEGMIDLAALTDGPGVSTRGVQQTCPMVPRRAIRQRLLRFQRACRAALLSLEWTAPGRVWAADWASPPHPLDGRDRAVVHVRDLASGFRLAVLPIPRPTGRAVTAVLQAACARADPPLVLKIDNGGACRSGALRRWAAAAGVTVLFSPPRWPAYNGSIEASIGGLASRVHEAAAWQGHPHYWTADDIVLARHQANGAVARDGTTATARWARRSPISAAERRRFQVALTQARRALEDETDAAYSGRVRERLAIVRTLEELGYLRITRSGEFGHSFLSTTRQR